MKNGKYWLGALIIVCGTGLSAYTGRSDYFFDTTVVLLGLGWLYRNAA